MFDKTEAPFCGHFPMMTHVQLISDDQYGNVWRNFDDFSFDVIPCPRFGDIIDEEHSGWTFVDVEKFGVEWHVCDSCVDGVC